MRQASSVRKRNYPSNVQKSNKCTIHSVTSIVGVKLGGGERNPQIFTNENENDATWKKQKRTKTGSLPLQNSGGLGDEINSQAVIQLIG